MKFDIKEEDMIIKPYNTPGPIYIREQKGKRLLPTNTP